MPKTASKSRSKSSKKTATGARRASTKSMTWWEKYCVERDNFYKCHPNVQWLLGIFIILFLIYLALVFTPVASYSFGY